MFSLNATKVRLAFECPRLFYLYQHFRGKTLFISPSSLPGIGKAFHELCEQCFKLAKTDPQFSDLLSQSITLENLNTQLQQLFYKLVFYPYLNTHPHLAAAFPQIWQALIELYAYWSELLLINKAYFSRRELIQNTLFKQEDYLNHSFYLPDGTTQDVAGAFDSLVFNRHKNRYCVVEYKTLNPIDPSAQLAQVALYSYMINAQKKLPVDAVVYCVFPEIQKYSYSWEELQNTIHTIIPYKLQQMREWMNWQQGNPNPPSPTTQPHLCNICPQKERCQTFFKSSTLSS